MKNYIAIHRFHSSTARKAYCSALGKPSTQNEWIAFGNSAHEHLKCR